MESSSTLHLQLWNCFPIIILRLETWNSEYPAKFSRSLLTVAKIQWDVGIIIAYAKPIACSSRSFSSKILDITASSRYRTKRSNSWSVYLMAKTRILLLVLQFFKDHLISFTAWKILILASRQLSETKFLLIVLPGLFIFTTFTQFFITFVFAEHGVKLSNSTNAREWTIVLRFYLRIRVIILLKILPSISTVMNSLRL